jgi:hypothetical protein
MGFFDNLPRARARNEAPDAGASGNAAPPPSGGGAPSGGGTEPFSEAAFRDLIQSYPPTNEGVRAAYAAAQARWGNQVPELLEHPLRLDKFKFKDGRVIDFIGAAGGPDARHVWNVEGPGHAGGGAAGALGNMAGGNWQAGMDPSYQFIKDEAQKALQSGAAARGTLLTGGFQKDMAKYMAGLASTEFGNIFGRNLSLAQLGLNAAGQAANVGTSYSGQAGNTTANQVNANTELTTGAGNARAAGTAAGASGWANTIGQLGAIVAPSAAEWLKRPKTQPTGGRTPYQIAREGGV